MNEYLDILERMIETKNIQQFCVFPDVKPFKIIKKDEEDLIEIIKKNPKKYDGRHLAVITLTVSKRGLKKKEDIFSIGIRIGTIDEDGTISDVPSKNWGVLLKYMPDDLENNPFKMSDVKKMVDLVYKKYLKSDFNGIFYKRYEEKLNYIKRRHGINESSRIHKLSRTKKSSKKVSKKTSKKTSKRISKKTSNRQSKRTSKKI